MPHTVQNTHPVRVVRITLQYVALFAFHALLTKKGVWTANGRKVVFGKLRRIFQNMIPGYPEKLQKQHGISGGCRGCGTSCQLLFTCPAYHIEKRCCTIYKVRPKVCRTFPVTPKDIIERNIVSQVGACGFDFKT